MVLEVDESSILEAFQHGIGSLLLCIGIAREERREVNELIKSDMENRMSDVHNILGFPSHPARRPSRQ